MTNSDALWRRTLARELSRIARASALDSLREPNGHSNSVRRVGITGPPGAGKSSLITMLAAHWLSQSRRVGILAIDPSSPVSGGSLLGDRVRMDAIADHSDLFIRSIPSGASYNGLCPNLPALMDAFEASIFDDLILETVGVGQVSYDARILVDTFVLVLVPESGDTVQAMKAGILETADIYVVNKSDLPAAKRLMGELRTIAKWRRSKDAWEPPIIMSSSVDNLGAEELSNAIAKHQAEVLTADTRTQTLTIRQGYSLRTAITQRIDEIMESKREMIASLSQRDATEIIAQHILLD